MSWELWAAVTSCRLGAASANSAWAARHASASGGEVGNGVWAETMTVAGTLAGQLIL